MKAVFAAASCQPHETLVGRQHAFEVVTVDEHGEIITRRTHEATVFTEPLGAGIGIEMVQIPPGAFTMGASAGEGYDDERPQHRVTVSAFYLGQFTVTQAQWAAIMDRTPPYRCRGAQRPVDRVSWEDAAAFCARLAQRTGRAYRLPSEAEWEYACRAGTTTAFHFGPTITTDLVNYAGAHVYGAGPVGVYRHESTDVGTFPANAFGLYDMHGNVWEWCADHWSGSYDDAPSDGRAYQGGAQHLRVLRGGSWHDPPGICRSAARLKAPLREAEDLYGFRLALTSLEETGRAWEAEGNPGLVGAVGGAVARSGDGVTG